MRKPTVKDSVLVAVDAYNEQQGADGVPVSKDTAAPLFGLDGAVDSLGLVNLIVCIEQQVEDDHGFPITLADERAMSQRRSPFQTLGLLIDYVTGLTEQARVER